MMSMYRDSGGKMVVDIKDCDTMCEVKILKMGNLGLTEFDTQLFSQLKNLVEMDISRNQVESIPAVVHLPRLRRLDCSHNRLNGLAFVGQFPQLEEINVEGNSLAFADFCIASYLCPKLKSINGQEVNCVELNRMTETRMQPKIHKVWSDHMMPLYSHSMNDDEFEVLADKFRQLVKACSKPTAKTITKFLDFRVDRLVDEFLSRVRKEEVIEFGGSEKTVKRNYTKKRSGKDERITDSDGVALCRSDELTATTIVDAVEAQQLHEDAMVVAIADEQGNGIVTAEHAAALIASEQLKECSSVTIFVENVPHELSIVAPAAVAASKENVEFSSTTTSTKPNKKDFVDEESERRLKTIASVKVDSRVQRATSEVGNANRPTEIRADDKQKVVRYWVYNDETSKTKQTSSRSSAASSSANAAGEGEVGGRAAARGRSASKERISSRKAMFELMALMKSKGTLPDMPKVKMPDIDAHQAAQRVVEIKTSPMVVYRGRGRQKDVRSRPTRVKLPATFKKTKTPSTAGSAKTLSVDAERFVDVPTDIPKSSPSPPTRPPSTPTADLPELTNGLSKAVETGIIKERSTSKINDSCFPPKKRVRFIDAFKDPVT